MPLLKLTWKKHIRENVQEWNMSVFICASVLNLYTYPLSFSFCLNQSPNTNHSKSKYHRREVANNGVSVSGYMEGKRRVNLNCVLSSKNKMLYHLALVATVIRTTVCRFRTFLTQWHYKKKYRNIIDQPTEVLILKPDFLSTPLKNFNK
jgi:hypothetical protein